MYIVQTYQELELIPILLLIINFITSNLLTSIILYYFLTMSVCEIDGIRVKSTYEKHTKCHQITQQTKKPLSEFIGMIMQSACRFAYRRIPITVFLFTGHQLSLKLYIQLNQDSFHYDKGLC